MDYSFSNLSKKKNNINILTKFNEDQINIKTPTVLHVTKIVKNINFMQRRAEKNEWQY